MRSAAQWLEEYGDSHRHPANERLHWICVPVIVWCVLGLLWLLPVPHVFRETPPAANWATVAALAAVLYYLSISPRLAVGAAILLAAMLCSISLAARLAAAPLWLLCICLFAAAWIGQFAGHAIEGKRPSFFKDVQFLLIGPLWLIAAVYRRLGLRP